VIRSNPVLDVNLTADGPLDWAHWGRPTSPPYLDRKAGVPTLVGDFVASGPISTQGRSTGDDTTPSFRWQDGIPTGVDGGANELGTRDRLFFIGEVSTSVEIKVAPSSSIPADGEQKALFYLGLYDAQAKLEIDFDDGSNAVPARTEQSGAALDVLYQVTFKRSPTNAKLRAKWSLVTADTDKAALRLSAVAVRQPP
jgi:hypothetical protein